MTELTRTYTTQVLNLWYLQLRFGSTQWSSSAERILNLNNLANSKQNLKNVVYETGAQMGLIGKKKSQRTKISRYCCIGPRAKFKLACPSALYLLPPPLPRPLPSAQVTTSSIVLQSFRGMDLNGAQQEVSTVSISIPRRWTI